MSPRKMTDEERVNRFWSYVYDTGFCWIWTAGKVDGYGNFYNGVRCVPAHRFAYKWAHPEWDEKLPLDHFVCDNPPCVNPDHVRPVTNKVNVLRGKGITAQNLRKTHCIRGHPYSKENTYVRKDTGERVCKTCNIEYRKRTYANKKGTK